MTISYKPLTLCISSEYKTGVLQKVQGLIPEKLGKVKACVSGSIKSHRETS
jgi:hypothetical protein